MDTFKAAVRRVVELSERTEQARRIPSPEERATAYEALMREAEEICRILREWKENHPEEYEAAHHCRA